MKLTHSVSTDNTITMKNITIPIGTAGSTITMEEEIVRSLQKKVCREEPLYGLDKTVLDAILSAICTGRIKQP